MSNIKELFNNYLFVCAVMGWFTAQFLKTLLVLITTRRFVPERLFGAGGMPSAHSATVTALTIASARACGLGSTEFAFAFVMAAVVIYDAMGVRRAAGEQAKVINKIVKINNSDNYEGNDIEDVEELKETLGHTPIEVLGGVLLGMLIAMVMPCS